LIYPLISAAITAVITYYVTLSKARLDLSVEYDRELRKSRTAAYAELWKKMKPLARYSVESPLTYGIVRQTSESMRDWYFDGSGILLSQASRDPYFKLKEAMQKIIDDNELERRPDEPLEESRLKDVHGWGSKLRNALSNDIGSREKPFLRKWNRSYETGFNSGFDGFNRLQHAARR
jgi:hypothetical protein